LKWPPLDVESEKPANGLSQEESKTELKTIINSDDAREKLYVHEMGFTLIIEAMINAKKPIIGHNCMYDLLYLYNQFIGELPTDYHAFITEWNRLFPLTYDTKVLCFASKSFYNTALGTVYEKCTSDDKFKNNLRFKFDTQHGCTNY